MAALTDTAVRQAIYQMGLDPTNYLKAIASVEQANVKLISSTEGVAVSEERVTAANQTSADGFARLEAKYDPLIRAEQRRQAAIAQANRFLEEGIITQERHAAQIARVNSFYDQQANVVGRAANSNINFNNTVGLGSTSVQRLGNIVQRAGFQTSLFVSDIASGQTSMRAFFNQGSQLLALFGGPWGAAFGAAIAIVGTLAVSLLNVRKETKEYGEEVDLVAKAEKDAKTATELYTTALDKANAVLLTSSERSDALAAARLAEAKATATASINVELDNIARLKNIEILRQQAFAATQQARAARVSGALPEGAGVPEAPIADINKQLDESFRRIQELMDLRTRLNDPSQFGETRDKAAKAAADAEKEATKSTKEHISVLGELINAQQIEFQQLQMTTQERAVDVAIRRATIAAQQDYDNLLRDSPLLTGEERAAIENKIKAILDLEAAQERSVEATREAEQAAADAARETEHMLRRAQQEGRQLGQDLYDLARGFQTLEEFAVRALQSIIDKLFELDLGLSGGSGGGTIVDFLTGAITSLFTSGIGSGAGDSLSFGGLYQHGGTIGSGEVGLVGEAGPELIRGPAEIIPMDKAGAMGGSTFIIDARGADGPGLRRLERTIQNINGSIEYRSVSAVLNERRRGGSFSRQFA